MENELDSVTGTDADELAAFNASAGPTETPAAGDDGAQPPAPEAATGEESPAAAPAAPAEPPKLAQITEDEYQSLLSKAAAIDEIKAELGKKMDTAFGKIGGVERLIQQLQTSAPAGEPVSLDDQDFAELKQEYPELAEVTLKGLNRLVGKLKGTGGQPAPAMDPAQLDTMLTQRMAPAMDSIPQTVQGLVADEFLTEKYGDWRGIVGAKDATDNAFRKWLAQQPAERQTQVNETFSHRVISQAITDFKAAQEAAADAEKRAEAANQRKSRLASAVTPRGTPGNTPMADDETAGFQASFSPG